MIKKGILLTSLLVLLTSCGSKATPDANIDLTQNNNQKTYVGFVATWCPHCNAEVPVLDAFYKENKGLVNMQLMVQDGKYFNGNYTIPQQLTDVLTYEKATGEKCDYVPSYVILNEEKQIIEKGCGQKLTKEELQTKLLGSATPSSQTGSFQTSGVQEGDIVATLNTNYGNIKIRLFPDQAPKTVTNFIGLAEKNYYNNVTFHRVIKDFMIQGGDPTATGMGGESIYGKEFEDEFASDLSNIRGSLSMANAGVSTNGSQFFINQKDNISLDNKHSVFGQVIEGMDIVDAIANVKTNSEDKPEKDVIIQKITIENYSEGKYIPSTFDAQKKIDEIKKADEEKIKSEEAAKKAKLEADKNRKVKAGDVIKVHYTGKTTSDGKVFDTSIGKSPLEFEVGGGQMIPGFDKGVIGLKIGDKKTLTLKPEEAYGKYDPKLVQEYPRSDLAEAEKQGVEIVTGGEIMTMYGPVKIVEANEKTVTLDLNSPLADKTLTFDVELIEFSN